MDGYLNAPTFTIPIYGSYLWNTQGLLARLRIVEWLKRRKAHNCIDNRSYGVLAQRQYLQNKLQLSLLWTRCGLCNCANCWCVFWLRHYSSNSYSSPQYWKRARRGCLAVMFCWMQSNLSNLLTVLSEWKWSDWYQRKRGHIYESVICWHSTYVVCTHAYLMTQAWI